MIEIGNTIVSRELLEKEFVCDLSACKGQCCVEGESGAPLEEDEREILELVYEDVEPYLPPKGRKAIEEQGKYVIDSDGDHVTPLVDNAECAYTVFEKDGTAKCGIEQAYFDGKISFRKPVSCHLYPVRVTKYSKFDAVNYHRWQICEPACVCGAKLQVPIYKFVKEALIRRFGDDWYAELEERYAAV